MKKQGSIGNDKYETLCGACVGSVRHGRAALVIARRLRNAPNSMLLSVVAILAMVSVGVLVDICNSNNDAYAEASSVYLSVSNDGVISNDVEIGRAHV